MPDWIERLRERGLWPKKRAVALGRRLLLAAVVGIVAGIGALAFHWMGQAVHHYTLGMFAGYSPTGPTGEHEAFHRIDKPLILWSIVLIIAIGGFVNALIVFTFAPEAAGHGTDAAIDAYHNKGGLIRARVPFVKMIASAITIGTGGSGGREGPIAQIGAGFGSFMATRLHMSDSERRTLMAAGVGAGVGAIFHAPLAGAIFAIEVLYRDPEFEAENLIPAFISSAVAYCAFNLGLSLVFGHMGFEPLFTIHENLRFDNPMLLLPLTVLAIAMTGAACIYVKTFYGIHDFFHRWKIPRILKPVIGAVATGLIAVGLFTALRPVGPTAQYDSLSVLSYGYGYLQRIIMPDGDQALIVWVLLAVGFGKMLTTALTIGSGGSGGVFGPSMVIGGSFGALVGMAFHQFTPGLVPDQASISVFVILGMASFFAAAANTPVSTLIMVTEMTASYTLLLPAMWVCALSYVLGGGFTIFREQVGTRLDSPAHRGDYIIDVLQDMKIRDAIGRATRSFVTVPIGMPLGDIVQMIADTYQTTFPVLDDNQQLHGLFTLNDVRQFLHETGGFGELAVAQDLAQPVEPLRLDTDLSSAIGRFAEGQFDELPVIEEDEKIIGLLRRQDVIAAYSRELLKHRQSQSDNA